MSDQEDTDAAAPRSREPEQSGELSRRSLFTHGGVIAAGTLALGALAGAAGGFAGGRATAQDDPEATKHPFYNQAHQAGIRTAPQKYTVFMTYDLTTSSVIDLQVLLARWSAAIAQLAKGGTLGDPEPSRPDAVATDTGEALGLGPAGLTVTLGLGPGVFDERFGLTPHKPKLLEQLPALPSDQLDPALTGGDLSLQACADDPQVAYHAIRNLTRMAQGTAATRWTVSGFGRASAGPHQQTPRNLLGFKDGTRNISSDEDYATFVWVNDNEQPWMHGGTYLVARKIHMNIEIWDTDRTSDQQKVIGRTKVEGAPLTGRFEHDTPDFTEKDSTGALLISDTAHISLAAHENNGGIKILRRPYNFTEGIDAFGQIDAGLLFIAYMNDPDHFVRLQTKLGSSDQLNEYIKHIGSALFAVPPAPRQGSYIGAALFA